VVLDGQLCGFIIAVQIDIPWAYMVPIGPVREDIARVFHIQVEDVRLPTASEISDLHHSPHSQLTHAPKSLDYAQETSDHQTGHTQIAITTERTDEKPATLLSQGKHSEAESLFREAVPGMEKVLEPQHTDTLVSKSGLAASLLSQGKNTEAESLLREVVPGMEKVFGLQHADTLVSKSNLAASLFSQRKNAEAESLFREVIPGMENVFGLQHANALVSKSRLAAMLFSQGKDAEAESLFREVVTDMEKVFGPQHANTLVLKSALAATLRAHGKNASAESLHREAEAVASREKVPESQHTDTPLSKDLATSLFIQESNTKGETPTSGQDADEDRQNEESYC
jgi:hypothetical protein